MGAAAGGIRYHAASPVEKSDTIQYLQASRKLGVAVVTRTSNNLCPHRLFGRIDDEAGPVEHDHA